MKLQKTTDATPTFIQQSPIDYASLTTVSLQGYLPDGTTTLGFSAGIWVKNPMSRTLNFELKFYNKNANTSVWWKAAADPSSLFPETNGWVFLTFSPNTRVNSGTVWAAGVDTVSYVRVTQVDDGDEGPWEGGEYLLISSVYVDCAARSTFMLGFDDGTSDQRNPTLTPITSGGSPVTSCTATTVIMTTAPVPPLIVGAAIKFTGQSTVVGGVGVTFVPTGLIAGTKYYVSSTEATGLIYGLTTDALFTTPVAMTPETKTCHWTYAGKQLRSSQQIVESYGFKGNLFIVPSWLDTNGTYGYTSGPNKFLTTAELIEMHNEGWSVGSHSNTHPSNNESAGLRLLGPYGYFLSNTFDNMSLTYCTYRSITAGNGRRRAISSAANTVTFENAHKFLLNQPVVFTDSAPGTMVVGTTYYVQFIGSVTTCVFATDQGSMVSLVTPGTWSGVANYRYPGSTNDSTAILADIEAGIAALDAIGITSGRDYFALPQGSYDEYVRQACITAKLGWVRGVHNKVSTIMVGKPSGGGLSGQIESGGWMSQVDAIQTDGATTAGVTSPPVWSVDPAIASIKRYVDDVVTLGACGCSYHHNVGNSVLASLDWTCAYLKTKSDAGVLDVITLDQMASRQVRT
jgi:hypothetical protein